MDLRGANNVTTPGDKEPQRKEGDNEDDAEELCPAETTRYRGLVARANYLAADRPDLMYATKELCRGMAGPTRAHWHRLKRFGRYLVGSPRTVVKYN